MSHLRRVMYFPPPQTTVNIGTNIYKPVNISNPPRPQYIPPPLPLLPLARNVTMNNGQGRVCWSKSQEVQPKADVDAQSNHKIKMFKMHTFSLILNAAV